MVTTEQHVLRCLQRPYASEGLSVLDFALTSGAAKQAEYFCETAVYHNDASNGDIRPAFRDQGKLTY